MKWWAMEIARAMWPMAMGWGKGFNFSSGTHYVEIHAFDTFNGTDPWILGSNVTAILYADHPFYSDAGTLFLGDFCWEDLCNTVDVGHNVSWTLIDNKPWVDGDANGDGKVDLEDLNLVRNRFGRVRYGIEAQVGDTLPYDGQVDLTDLNRVRNNFGSTASVPEPGTIGLLALGMFLLWRFRR